MFEIHLTVDCESHRREEFTKTCEMLHVKPLVISLNGDPLHTHTMTSSIHLGDYEDTLKELERIEEGLSNFKIIRYKVETHPSNVLKFGFNYTYYEVHLEVDSLFLDTINTLKFNGSWYISNNLRKPDYSILTCRLNNWDHRDIIEKDFYLLESLAIIPSHSKPIYEFAILDTNPSLDDEWMK